MLRLWYITGAKTSFNADWYIMGVAWVVHDSFWNVSFGNRKVDMSWVAHGCTALCKQPP